MMDGRKMYGGSISLSDWLRYVSFDRLRRKDDLKMMKRIQCTESKYMDEIEN